MTKKDMAKSIAEVADVLPAQALAIIQAVFDGITETLVKESRIELRGFGVFQVKKRRPRNARNPRTGETVDVPAKFVVTFKAGRKMEQRVCQLKIMPREEQ